MENDKNNKIDEIFSDELSDNSDYSRSDSNSDIDSDSDLEDSYKDSKIVSNNKSKNENKPKKEKKEPKEKKEKKEKKENKKAELVKMENLEKLKNGKYLDTDEENQLKEKFYGKENFLFLESIMSKIKTKILMEDGIKSNIELQSVLSTEDYKVLEKFNYNYFNDLLKSKFKHSKRRAILFPIIDRHPDYTLKCIYSNEIIDIGDGIEKQKCDEEHSMPQSYQSGSKKGTGRDLHQMFACTKNANGSRGNKAFGLFEDSKISNEKSFGTFYKTTIDSKEITTFIPKYNLDVVCRASLYIFTTYDAAIDRKKIGEKLLNFIKKSAQTYYISDWERHRNNEIHKYQLNRNPFIDYPFLAQVLSFERCYFN